MRVASNDPTVIQRALDLGAYGIVIPLVNSPAEAEAARAEALAGKEIHAFHLSKNYRNSSEIYANAAAYAERVGLDADLPEAVRSTGEHPVTLSAGGDLEGTVRRAVVDIAGRVAGFSTRTVVSRVANS